MPTTLKDQAAAFFYIHAGYSYDPKTETPEQGRTRCAELLAQAERDARSAALRFEWSQDDVDTSEWSDEEPRPQFQCICYSPIGDVLASLGGIDLGGEYEQGGSYVRVVEAELACEALPELHDQEEEKETSAREVIRRLLDMTPDEATDFLTNHAEELEELAGTPTA